MGRDDEERRLLGRMLVLLGDGNELRALRAPAWRVRRNRLRLDRALVRLGQLRDRELVTHSYRTRSDARRTLVR